MPSTDSLLTTKLYLPPRPPALVARPRLLGLLTEGLTRPLTLISAPAGFGKTTLFSEWCASEAGRTFPLAWLSLDNGDNDPARFLTYLIGALRTLRPGIGEAALAALQSQQPPPIHTLLIALVNDVTVIPGPFGLALDDYQAITSQAVHEAVQFLLDHLPPHMHLVLLTRADPPLLLARLRARDQLTEIRMLSLRFLPEEAAAFLNDAMGLGLSPADVSALEARTEGWIAGLQLAAFSLRQQADKHAFVAAFAGDDRYVMDYLLEEVLHRQPADLQAFLLKTSILDRLCAPLCQAVTGAADSQAILTRLEGANLFVVPMDSQRHWYRYHQLFADLLRRRLQQAVGLPGMTALYQQACAWYESQGLIVEALSQALVARDFEHAAALLERHVLEVFFRGETMLVHNWLKALPESALRPRPLLCAMYANTIAHAGLFQAPALQLTETWLQAALAALPAAGPDDRPELDLARDFVALSRAYLAFWRGDPLPTVIDLARQALAGLPAAGQVPPDSNYLRLRSGLHNNLGLSHLALGDEEAAGRAFVQAREIGEACGDLLNACSAASSQSRILRRHGRLPEAAALCRDVLGSPGIRHLPGGQPVPYTGVIYVALGRILLEWNDLAAAEPALVKGIELGQLVASPDNQLESRLALARLKLARQDLAGALGLLDSIEAGSPKAAASVAASRARLYLAGAGQDAQYLEKALDWARGRRLSDPDSSWLGGEALTLVRALIAASRPSPAVPRDLDPVLRFLDGQLRAAQAAGWVERMIELLALRALACRACDETAAALESLERALVLARPGGYVRIFVDEGLPMQQLLSRLKVEDPGLKDYQGRLLAAGAAMKAVSALPFSPQPLIDPLSGRELEVLRLLAGGASNAEIARQLVITLNTTKKHVTHIFEKLGVEDRGEAARRARDLGLVTSSPS